jgi:hypothetical protein
MHLQKLLTRRCGDNDDSGGVERGGICSRWSPDASSCDFASDSASVAPSRGTRRKRGSCCFGAFYGCDVFDGDGTVLPDCCGRAAVFGSRSFFTGISGCRHGGGIVTAAGLAVLLTVLLVLNVSSRGDQNTRSLVEIRERYSTTTAAKGATAGKGTTAAKGATAALPFLEYGKFGGRATAAPEGPRPIDTASPLPSPLPFSFCSFPSPESNEIVSCIFYRCSSITLLKTFEDIFGCDASI